MTITGAGGCGKTRLALEVARAHVDRFADGVWLVELASLADASLVTQTIAATLGIPSTGRPSDEVLSEFLRNRQALLVLDNCEHVIEACALLIEHLLLVYVLFLSTLVLVPGQSLGLLAAELVVLGCVLLGSLIVLDVGTWRLTPPEFRPAGGGLYWLVPAVLLAFIAALADAWVLLIQIVR